MKAIWALVLFPVLAFASEDCLKQLGGKCKPACGAGEKAEQGAFTDCAEKERCCVPAPARASAAASLVVIDGMAFSPEVLKVKAGAEVVWRNDDGSAHTVTAEDGSFASPPLNQGSVFKKVFAKPGTYPYACEMHPFMSGKIVVD